MIKIKILVATHKNIDLPFSDIFMPVHVGKKTSSISTSIVGDDTGDNISEKNDQYCELTAIYWAFKNLSEFEYIGLYHYRRFLTFKKNSFPIKFLCFIKFLGTKFFLNTFFYHKNYTYWPRFYGNSFQEFLEIQYRDNLKSSLLNNDILVAKPIILSSYNVKTFWGLAISIKIFDLVESIIGLNYPHMLSFFQTQINDSKIYPCSIFVFKKDLFNEYSNFIFGVLFELEKKCIKNNISLLPRTMGYMGEVLTSTFILYSIERGSKVKTLDIQELSI
jgi:hypothetical protein